MKRGREEGDGVEDGAEGGVGDADATLAGAAVAHKRADFVGDVFADTGVRNLTETKLFKILIPKASTGVVIGKKGANITSISTESGAKVRLSQNAEFYPGTEDRVLILEGGHDAINAAVAKTLRLMLEDPTIPDSTTRQTSVRALVPVPAGGAIIGKGGSVVKQLNELTGARTSVSPLDAVSQVTTERIVTISGNMASIEAVFQRLITLSYRDTEQWNWTNRSSRYTYDRAPARGMALAAATGSYPPPSMGGHGGPHGMYGGPPSSSPMMGGMGGRGPPPSPSPYSPYGAPAAPPSSGYGAPPPYYGAPAPAAYGGGGYPAMDVTSSKMEVDDTYIGRLVGKGGSVLAEIIASTKAQIKISQKGEYVAGTNYRIVTVTGYPQNVALAMQRIQEVVYSAAQHNTMPHQ